MTAPDGFPKSDAGSGKFNDYRFNLLPNNRRVVMRLAGSDPAQAELAEIAAATEVECIIASRTLEEERTDAPMPVRFLASRRMSGIVGYVPRGLESVVVEALARLEAAGKTPRIPARIYKTKGKWRVDLLMGETR